MNNSALMRLARLHRIEVWYIERMKIYGVAFIDSWVINDGVKSGIFGVGESPEQAALDYLQKIDGKKLEIAGRETMVIVRVLDDPTY